MSCHIMENGRVIVEAQVRVVATGDSEPVRLVIDTGSAFTMIASSTAKRIMDRNPGHIRLNGTMHLQNFGLTYTVIGLYGVVLDLEVEDFGGGNQEIRSDGLIFAHDIEPPDKLFPANVDGLLGMILLDKLGVDMVKNLAKTRAYLAKRV